MQWDVQHQKNARNQMVAGTGLPAADGTTGTGTAKTWLMWTGLVSRYFKSPGARTGFSAIAGGAAATDPFGAATEAGIRAE